MKLKMLYRNILVFLSIFVGIATNSMHNDPGRYIPAALSNLPAGVHAYLQKIPKIKHTAENIHEKAKVIKEFLCDFSKSTVFPLKNTDKRGDKIKIYLQQDKPIACILLGFPVKSSNTENKVIAC